MSTPSGERDIYVSSQTNLQLFDKYKDGIFNNNKFKIILKFLSLQPSQEQEGIVISQDIIFVSTYFLALLITKYKNLML